MNSLTLLKKKHQDAHGQKGSHLARRQGNFMRPLIFDGMALASCRAAMPAGHADNMAINRACFHLLFVFFPLRHEVWDYCHFGSEMS